MSFEKIPKDVAIWTAQKTHVDKSGEEQDVNMIVKETFIKQSQELLLHDGVEYSIH